MERVPQMLRFVAKYWERHGFAPTVRDVQRGTRFSSPSVVTYWMNKAREENLLQWELNSARTLRLTEKGLLWLKEHEHES